LFGARACLHRLDDIGPSEIILGSHTASAIHELGAELEKSLVSFGEPASGLLRRILQGEDSDEPDQEGEYSFNDVDISPPSVTQRSIQVTDSVR
jgi:hypothetical protein